MKKYKTPMFKPHKLRMSIMVMASQDAPVTPNKLEDFDEVNDVF